MSQLWYEGATSRKSLRAEKLIKQSILRTDVENSDGDEVAFRKVTFSVRHFSNCPTEGFICLLKLPLAPTRIVTLLSKVIYTYRLSNIRDVFQQVGRIPSPAFFEFQQNLYQSFQTSVKIMKAGILS